jgi:hypothetical protein
MWNGSALVPVDMPGNFTPMDNCDRLIDSGATLDKSWLKFLCVFTREFESGTKVYYNGTAYHIPNATVNGDPSNPPIVKLPNYFTAMSACVALCCALSSVSFKRSFTLGLSGCCCFHFVVFIL